MHDVLVGTVLYTLWSIMLSAYRIRIYSENNLIASHRCSSIRFKATIFYSIVTPSYTNCTYVKQFIWLSLSEPNIHRELFLNRKVKNNCETHSHREFVTEDGNLSLTLTFTEIHTIKQIILCYLCWLASKVFVGCTSYDLIWHYIRLLLHWLKTNFIFHQVTFTQNNDSRT